MVSLGSLRRYKLLPSTLNSFSKDPFRIVGLLRFTPNLRTRECTGDQLHIFDLNNDCVFEFLYLYAASPVCHLLLTEEIVELLLDESRPSSMADGGNVALHEIDGLVVVLKLQGACGSCLSSIMTLKMGIENLLMDKIP